MWNFFGPLCHTVHPLQVIRLRRDRVWMGLRGAESNASLPSLTEAPCLHIHTTGPCSSSPSTPDCPVVLLRRCQDPCLAGLSLPPARASVSCQAWGQEGAGGETCLGREAGRVSKVRTIPLVQYHVSRAPWSACLGHVHHTLRLLGGWSWAAGRWTGWSLSTPSFPTLLAASILSQKNGPLPGPY